MSALRVFTVKHPVMIMALMNVFQMYSSRLEFAYFISSAHSVLTYSERSRPLFLPSLRLRRYSWQLLCQLTEHVSRLEIAR